MWRTPQRLLPASPRAVANDLRPRVYRSRLSSTRHESNEGRGFRFLRPLKTRPKEKSSSLGRNVRPEENGPISPEMKKKLRPKEKSSQPWSEMPTVVRVFQKLVRVFQILKDA